MRRFIMPGWYRVHRVEIGLLLVTVGLVLALGTCWVLLRQAEATHEAICALNADYQQRLDRSRDFLRLNPHGALGFSRAQIQQQIDLQRRTVEALRVADC